MRDIPEPAPTCVTDEPPAPPPEPADYPQRKLDNELSHLLSLTPDLLSKIVSRLEPISRQKCSLLVTCTGLFAMASCATDLEVSGMMFVNPAAKAFLARFPKLRSLEVVHSPPSRLDLSPMWDSVSRLQYLEVVTTRKIGDPFRPLLDCEAISGLKSLELLSIQGYKLAHDLILNPSVTHLILHRCQMRESGRIASSTGLRILLATELIADFDLRCSPDLEEVDAKTCNGSLQLPVPRGVVKKLKIDLFDIPGEVLSQLTNLSELKCKTTSAIVDLSNRTRLKSLVISGNLTHLDVSNCTRLDHLVIRCDHLCELRVRGCTELISCSLSRCDLRIQPFQPGTAWVLKELDLSYNMQLMNISGLPSSLLYLNLEECYNVDTSIPLVLPRLDILNVGCSFPDLDLTGCPALRKLLK